MPLYPAPAPRRGILYLAMLQARIVWTKNRSRFFLRCSGAVRTLIFGSQIMSRRFWSSVVHSLSPYVPGEQPKLDGVVKLNTNENPYGPSPHVLTAIASATDRLHLYPDPRASCLRETIAARYDVAPEAVFVGNGSDEVLAHTFQALLKHDAPLLFPDITYSFYPVYCRLYGVEYREIPLTGAFEIAIDDFLQPNGGIIFPNPNAPTGRFLAIE